MKGTCQGMCAKGEVAERQAQQDISFFEATEETRSLRRSARKLDPTKAVKRFRRAADGRGETCGDVRPLPWLEKTMGHLWEVGLAVLVVVGSGSRSSSSSSNSSSGGMSVSEVPQLVEVYDFLSDRFMAVRKDMILQGICGAGARSIYRRIVRFYILFDYLLTQQVPPIFDQHLGLNALRSGLATLFDFYKEANILSEQQASNKGKEGNGTTAAAEGSTHTHTPPKEHQHLDEFLAYHVLLQTHDVLVLGNSSSSDVNGETSGWEKLFLQLHRILGKIKLTLGEEKEGEEGEGEGEKKQQQALSLPKTQFALDVATSLATANYARFYRLFRGGVSGGSGGDGDTAAAAAEAQVTDLGTDVLLKCLLHKLLPAVRRQSLEVWSKTLFKKEKMYLEEVTRLLCFEDMEHAAQFLGLYQLTVTREEVVGEENGEKGGGVSSSKRVYLEPRASSLGYLAQGQSLDERKATRAKFCKRQDADVLGGFAPAALSTLWLILGTL